MNERRCGRVARFADSRNLLVGADLRRRRGLLVYERSFLELIERTIARLWTTGDVRRDVGRIRVVLVQLAVIRYPIEDSSFERVFVRCSRPQLDRHTRRVVRQAGTIEICLREAKRGKKCAYSRVVLQTALFICEIARLFSSTLPILCHKHTNFYVSRRHRLTAE